MKLILLLLLIFVPAVAAQDTRPKNPNDVLPEPEKCIHETDDDFYASLRHTPPVRLLMVDGRTLTVMRMTTKLIDHKTFFMHKSIRMPVDIYRISEKRKFLVLFCFVHRVVFVVEEIK